MKKDASTLANQATTARSLIEGGVNLYKTSKDFWHDHFSYSIVITERDPLYYDILDWVVSVAGEDRPRAVVVTSSRRPNVDWDSTSESASKISPIVVRFDTGRTKNLTIEGYPVTFSILKPEAPSDTKEATNSFNTSYIEPTKISFRTRSRKAQDAVLRKLEEINQNRAQDRNPVLRMINTWGSWKTRADLPLRSMESVSIPQTQKSRIVQDLQNFLDAEERYNRLGIPWHRGYMFYGPPGTGKTSLVKALASEFKLDLWYISLSDLKAESSLISLMADVGPRSLLLLEDIDTVKITHNRDDTKPGEISMSSLLNTLDGVATPHGLITVMTTNRFDILDPALTRAGRMDLIEHLDYPTVETLTEMYRHFYEVSPRWGRIKDRDIPLEGVSAAHVAEVMKRNLNDPVRASQAILNLIRKNQ